MDEKNGLYDLNMIKSAKLLTDITKSEEQIYYNVYSSVNNTEITNGNFWEEGHLLIIMCCISLRKREV